METMLHVSMSPWFVVLVLILHGVVMGIAATLINQNKGYDDFVFFWGFFFGIVAQLVLLSKPDKQVEELGAVISAPERRRQASEDEKRIQASGGWKCSCGKVHPAHVGTCGCGQTRSAQTLAHPKP